MKGRRFEGLGFRLVIQESECRAIKAQQFQHHVARSATISPKPWDW